MKYLLFVIVLFTTQASFGQYSYEAKVLDGISNEPIADVNIKISKTISGTSSNAKGEFNIDFSQLPTTIILTHIAYEQEIRVITVLSKRTEVIYLYPRNDRLKEIVITAENKIESLSDIESYSVSDFEFLGDKIYRLEFHDHLTKFVLSVTDHDGVVEQTLSLKKMHGVQSLFKSCNNVIYIIAKNYAYPLAVKDYKIQIEPKIQIDTFDDNIRPCKLRIENDLYFIRKYMNELVSVISRYDIEKEEHSLISIISEDDLVRGFKEKFGLIQRATQAKSVHTNSYAENQKFRSLQENSDFYIEVFFKPEFPVYINSTEENIVIFNHIERKLEWYLKDELEDEVEIDYVFDDKWLKEIRFDKLTEKAYGIYDLKTGIGVKRINLSNGNIELVGIVDTPIQSQSKIQIFNNSIYYLKAEGSIGSKVELFKFDL